MKSLSCWNHLINAAKVWLKNHGASHAEVPVYVSHIHELLNQPSSEAYVTKLDILKRQWSKAFLEYFMSQIHPEVRILEKSLPCLSNTFLYRFHKD